MVRLCIAITLLCICCSTSLYAHKKIYLLRDSIAYGSPVISDGSPYHFVNKDDTVYISFRSSSDMGYTWFTYGMRYSAPTDTYSIYVNNLLDRKGYFKNGSRVGKWIFYNEDRSFSTRYYYNNTIYGLFEEFDKKGRLSKRHLIDTLYGNTIKTEFHEDGLVASNEFWLNGRELCGEVFTERGTLEYMYHTDSKKPMTGGFTLFSNGKIHGKVRREYKSGCFELVYRWNEIIEWSYYDSTYKKVATRFPLKK